MAWRTGSKSPTETPPIEITASASRTASVIARWTGIASSGRRSSRNSWAPHSSSSVRSMRPLLSRMRPGSSAAATSRSSLPVESTTTRGLGPAGIRANPSEASRARSCGESSRPGAKATAPASRSRPGSRTLAPDPATRAKRAVAARAPAPGPAPATRSSIGTTASASAGSMAPVMMRIVAPAGRASGATRPAASVAITRSSTGSAALAPARSAARTAKPSTAELRNGGSGWGAVSAWRSARPRASASGMISAGRARAASITRARASG